MIVISPNAAFYRAMSVLMYHSMVVLLAGYLPAWFSDGMLVAYGLPVQAKRAGCATMTGSARFKEEVRLKPLLPPCIWFHYYLLHRSNGCVQLADPSHCPHVRLVSVAGLHVRHPAVPIPGRTENMVSVPPVNWAFGTVRTTLSGGSLGSCVDEERSQLCELM